MFFHKTEICLIILSAFVLNVISLKPSTSTKIKSKKTSNIIQCDQPTINHGTVRIKNGGRMANYRCANGYTLYGSKYSACIRGHWDMDIPICIKPGCPTIIKPPNGILMGQNDNAEMSIHCDSTYEVVGSINTLCNGTHWDRQLGTCRKTNIRSMTWCDFDVKSICGWYNDPSYNFDWKHRNGGNRRFHIGPKFDHTTKQPYEGFFMFLDNSARYYVGVARLISPIYDSNLSDGTCFKFFYHLYGLANGKINIYIRPNSLPMETITETKNFLLYEITNTQQNTWNEALVELIRVNDKFQIIIEGRLTGTKYGDIAIDDVALLSSDECSKIKNEITEEENEEVGDILDIQSCENRCDELITVTQNYLTINGEQYQQQCDCFDDCIDNKTCCPDYQKFCITDDASEISDISDITITTDETSDLYWDSIIFTTEQDRFASTIIINKNLNNFDNVLTTIVNNDDDYSELVITTECTNETESIYQSNTNIIEDKANLQEREELKDNLQLIKHPEYDESQTTTIVLIISFLFIIIIISIIIFIICRKRKPENYKKNYQQSTKNVNEEFSEIRYLTADEHLDFNIATPQS